MNTWLCSSVSTIHQCYKTEKKRIIKNPTWCTSAVNLLFFPPIWNFSVIIFYVFNCQYRVVFNKGNIRRSKVIVGKSQWQKMWKVGSCIIQLIKMSMWSLNMYIFWMVILNINFVVIPYEKLVTDRNSFLWPKLNWNQILASILVLAKTETLNKLKFVSMLYEKVTNKL